MFSVVFCRNNSLSNCLSVLVVFIAAEEDMETTTTAKSDSSCNCDSQCSANNVIGLKRNSSDERTFGLLDEDTDEDDDSTICARNRDMVDRTFSSVCHMMCYNRCTRYRTLEIKEDDEKSVYLAAFRESKFYLFTLSKLNCH